MGNKLRFKDILGDQDYIMVRYRPSKGFSYVTEDPFSSEFPDSLFALQNILEGTDVTVTVFITSGGATVVRDNPSISPSRVSIHTPIDVLLTL